MPRRHRHALRALAIPALLALAAPALQHAPTAHAATSWYVATNGTDSPSCGSSGSPCATAGFVVANLAASGDTVNIASGSYNDQIVIPAGWTLTLMGGNPFVSAQTTIHLTSTPASNNGSVLTVHTGATVLAQGLTFTGGTGTPIIPGFTAGGGVFNEGHLTLLDTTTTNNTASGYGGGIYSDGYNGAASVLVQYSFLQNNTVDATGGTNIAKGGGVYNDFGSTLSIVCSAVTGNAVKGDNSAFGGAIGNVSTDITTMIPVVSTTYSTTGNEVLNTVIAGNSASGAGTVEGGAVFNTGNLTFNDETLAQNTATATSGGGQSLGGAIFATTTASGLVLNNVTIAQNQAIGAGGAPAAGGAIFSEDVGIVATNVTIADNTATSPTSAAGAGIGRSSSSNLITDPSNLTNTLLARNTAISGAASAASDCAGNALLTDSGGNIDDDGTCGLGTGPGSLSNNHNIGLGQLGNNGGDQPTEALAYPTSSAIGTGVASACEALIGPNGVSTDVDERGLPRHAVTRGTCDSGAYDTGGNITLASTVTGATLASGGKRLGIAASTDPRWNIGYITLQLGSSSFVVRHPAVSCPNQCAGTAAAPLAQPATYVLTGVASSTQGSLVHRGDAVEVDLTVQAIQGAGPGSPVTFAVTQAVVKVNGITVATFTGPYAAPGKLTYTPLNQQLP